MGADADGGAGGNGGGGTEEVVVTLPPYRGHAESVSAYVHVGFSHAVETWVRLSAPPVESCFCKTYHWGGPKFTQAQREVQFDSDGCALLEHPMPWRSGYHPRMPPGS